MSAWDEAVHADARQQFFYEDASESFRALQELVGEWQEIRSVSTDTAFDESRIQSMQRIKQAATAHAIQLSNCLVRAEANPIYRGEVSRQKFEQVKDKARSIYSLYLMPMDLSAREMKYLASGTMASHVLPDATTTYSSFSRYYEHEHLKSENKGSASAITATAQLQQQTQNSMLEVVPVTDADLRDDERQEAEQLAITAHQIEVTFTECLELLQCQRKIIDSGGIEQNINKANELVEESDKEIAKAGKYKHKKVRVVTPLVGTGTGLLIGLVAGIAGGPVGMAVGAIIGAAAGAGSGAGFAAAVANRIKNIDKTRQKCLELQKRVEDRAGQWQLRIEEVCVHPWRSFTISLHLPVGLWRSHDWIGLFRKSDHNPAISLDQQKPFRWRRVSKRARENKRLRFHWCHAPNTPGTWSLRYFASTSVGLNVMYALAHVLEFEVKPKDSGSSVSETNINLTTAPVTTNQSSLSLNISTMSNPSSHRTIGHQTSSSSHMGGVAPRTTFEMGDGSAGQVDEGFICPNCRMKFPSDHALIDHFNTCNMVTDQSTGAMRTNHASAVKDSPFATVLHKTGSLWQKIASKSISKR